MAKIIQLSTFIQGTSNKQHTSFEQLSQVKYNSNNYCLFVSFIGKVIPSLKYNIRIGLANSGFVTFSYSSIMFWEISKYGSF